MLHVALTWLAATSGVRAPTGRLALARLRTARSAARYSRYTRL